MVQTRLPQLSTAMTVLVAVVFLLVLADLGFVAVLATRNASVQLAPAAASPKTGTDGQKQKAAHPCNHGYYVSQAAHSKKGGQYTSGIAQSDLGKNGNCSAPLPAQPPAKKKGSGS
jgi:hypothetical protein